MIKMRKRLLFVLAVILTSTLFLVACGGNDGDLDPRAFQEVPDGPWNTPFENPVHITAVGNHGAHWSFAPGDDVGNSPWTRLFEEELNVVVDFLWTSVD